MRRLLCLQPKAWNSAKHVKPGLYRKGEVIRSVWLWFLLVLRPDSSCSLPLTSVRLSLSLVPAGINTWQQPLAPSPSAFHSPASLAPSPAPGQTGGFPDWKHWALTRAQLLWLRPRGTVERLSTDTVLLGGKEASRLRHRKNIQRRQSGHEDNFCDEESFWMLPPTLSLLSVEWEL